MGGGSSKSITQFRADVRGLTGIRNSDTESSLEKCSLSGFSCTYATVPVGRCFRMFSASKIHMVTKMTTQMPRGKPSVVQIDSNTTSVWDETIVVKAKQGGSVTIQQKRSFTSLTAVGAGNAHHPQVNSSQAIPINDLSDKTRKLEAQLVSQTNVTLELNGQQVLCQREEYFMLESEHKIGSSRLVLFFNNSVKMMHRMPVRILHLKASKIQNMGFGAGMNATIERYDLKNTSPTNVPVGGPSDTSLNVYEYTCRIVGMITETMGRFMPMPKDLKKGYLDAPYLNLPETKLEKKIKKQFGWNAATKYLSPEVPGWVIQNKKLTSPSNEDVVKVFGGPLGFDIEPREMALEEGKTFLESNTEETVKEKTVSNEMTGPMTKLTINTTTSRTVCLLDDKKPGSKKSSQSGKGNKKKSKKAKSKKLPTD